jgi:hypothetical protein
MTDERILRQFGSRYKNNVKMEKHDAKDVINALSRDRLNCLYHKVKF